jgi:WD40 repeat protein
MISASEPQDILRWLVDRKLYNTVMAFEKETGVSLLGYSGKIRTVRDLCFEGDYVSLRDLISRLCPSDGDAINSILIQELRERLRDVHSRSDMAEFLEMLERVQNSLSVKQYRTFSDAASNGGSPDPIVFSNWKGTGARYELFEMIVERLQPLFPNDISPLEDADISPILSKPENPLSLPPVIASPSSIAPPTRRTFEIRGEFKKSQSSIPIRAVAFSNSGKYLAVGTCVNSLTVCDIPTMDPIGRSRKLHAGSVFACAWSPDDTLLATGSNDQLLRVASVARVLECDEEDRPIRLQLDLGTVRSLVFSQSGGSLIAGFSSDSIVREIECNSGAVVNRFDCKQLGGYINSVSRLNDMIVAACSSGEVCVFDSRLDRARIWTSLSSQEGLPAVADISPDGNCVGIGSGTGAVSLWDIRSASGPVWNKADMHSESVRAVKFSATGSWLASASFDKTVKVTSTTFDDISILSGHSDRVVGLAWCKGEYLASSGTDGRVVLWS